MARHQPTQEQRANVTVLTGLGASVEMIAGLLNVEPDTVKSAYAKELAQGPDTVRVEAMKQLFNASKTADGAGRVTAAVKLLDMLSRDDQVAAEGNVIRIRAAADDGSNERAVHIAPFGQWPADLEIFDREGRRVIPVIMLPGDDQP